MIDWQEKIREEEQKLIQNSIRREKKPLRRVAYFTLFLVITFFFFSSRLMVTSHDSDSWINDIPILKNIKHLAESADREMGGDDQDRINILLLGMGGKQHDGGYLTDTILLASLKPSTKEVSLLSIPRDLAIPVENMGWTKVNNINAFAEAKNKDSGGEAVIQALSDVLDMPIQYYLRADFEGFINIINQMDGITVNVANTLEDFKYPIMGQEDNPDYYSRYEHLYIEAGEQEMDGELALKYARSRHAYGIEGSDFARSRRQMLILQAAKDKLLDKSNLLKPTMISNILRETKDHVSTNLKIWEILKLWSNFKDVNNDDVINNVLDDGPYGLLTAGRSEAGAYILLPASGDFAEIQYLISSVFDSPSEEDKTEIVSEDASVEIVNGTWINGLASRTATDLEKYNFEITRVGNAEERNATKSVIYDLTYGEKINSLKILKEQTNASVSFDLPEWLIEKISNDALNNPELERPDFILILGRPTSPQNQEQ